MQWLLPAKTFLLGEYAAIYSQSAILLTTNPCFKVSLRTAGCETIHPDSPAGLLWSIDKHRYKKLLWKDPYNGKGGLGASSAQFLGGFLASSYLQKSPVHYQKMLDVYEEKSFSGFGLRPSGYDVLAQSQNRCVYINRQENSIKSYDWVFKDISFILLHTGQKLSTHTHLQVMKPLQFESLLELDSIVSIAALAFEKKDSSSLIAAINSYQKVLISLNLLNAASAKKIRELQGESDVLAAKGCGALGADVLILIVPSICLQKKVLSLRHAGWDIIATNKTLYTGRPLIKKHVKH